jgi:hypothetical protein
MKRYLCKIQPVNLKPKRQSKQQIIHLYSSSEILMSEKKSRGRPDLKPKKAEGIVPQNLRQKLAIAD